MPFTKVIIAGSRDFATEEHYDILQSHMDQYILDLGLPNQIVCGGARGADSLGRRYANENQIEVITFLPDWDKLGKRAGIQRNIEMGKYADALVAFWDGCSVGTKHMIEFALKRRLEVITVMFQNNNNNAAGTFSES
jgi:hypothetical protein